MGPVKKQLQDEQSLDFSLSFWLLLRLRRPQIQTLISMSTWMPRIAKEENLQKLGEEFWSQTPAETMDTGRPAPAAAPYAHAGPPAAAPRAHAHPHGIEKGTAAKRKLQIIAEMLEIMATGVQNAAHPSRGTAESNDREWKWSQVDWCNDRNGIHGGKIFFIFIFKII